MPDDVARAQVREVNILHSVQDAAHQAQARDLAARQVHLRNIAGDHDLRTKAQTGQEHLHLRRRGVLRLVEDDKGVVERAATHVCQRGDLDDACFHELRDHLWIHHVAQGVVKRAQVRVDLVI